MKKSLFIAITISSLLISLIITAFPFTVRADSTGSLSFLDSALTIFSPLNTTYNNRNLILNVTVPIWSIMGMPNSVSMNYSIDGTYNGQVPLRNITPPDSPPIATKAGIGAGRVNLPELPDGSHYLTIYLYGLNMENYQPQFKSYIYTVFFSTDDPNSIFSPTPSQTPTPTLQPSPTQTPIITPSQASSNYFLNPTFLTEIALVIVIVAVASVLLVYFKRRRLKQ
jgi:hypothetical protein